MASMKLLSLTCIFLLSGLLVFGTASALTPEPCPAVCTQDGYITCDNYPCQKLDVCCECAPEDGINCVFHDLITGDTSECTQV